MSSSHRLLRIAAPVLLAALVQSCGSDTGTGPDLDRPATLANALEEVSYEQLGEIIGRAPVTSPIFVSVPRAGCNYDAASVSFICVSNTSTEGITFQQSFMLLDAAGNRQSAFNPSTTAALRIQSHFFGTSSSDGITFTIDDIDDRTVSGLLTSRHVLDGTSTLKLNGTIQTGNFSSTVNDTVTMRIEGLVLPSPSNTWPGPGTVTTDDVTVAGAFTSHLQLVARFTGTKCVTMSLVHDGTAEAPFAVDLSNLSNPGNLACTP